MTTAEALFSDALERARPAAPWLEQRRTDALRVFHTKGVPHRRVEDWKYSDLKTAIEGANDLGDDSIALTIGAPDGIEQFDLSNLTNAPDWVQAHLGKAAQAGPMPAVALTLARKGVAIRVPKNTHPATPLRLAITGAGHARALIVLEEGASLTLVESRDATAGFSNVAIEAVLGANAQLTHIRSAVTAPGAIQVEDVAIRVARDAAYRAHLFNGGAKLARLNLRLTLREPGANAHLSGVSVLGGLHADVTTEVHHASGHTHSEQLFKKVVGGKGRAVYQGRITVAEGADKSDSRQTAKALLMGVRAEADLKPELEIFADDVKCAHGAAVGDLDPNSLFYLRARGIPEAEARNMLVRAFLEEAVAEIADDSIRANVWQSVEDALPQAMTP
ncbi:MAG: Fe-S cluster assembly protein SufD [Alphaproteobacteria bacterium]|nr:Fe-S cluster assembly protein SufD [Alphaproteobacteria bacterium]